MAYIIDMNEDKDVGANKYYVYIYLDSDNIPFYVGKGNGKRYYVSGHLHKNHSNDFLKNKIRKVGVANIKIYFLHKNLAETRAFQQERYWIKYYGRRDLGLGPLCNLTDGGDGPSGIIFSEEHKQRISEARKGQVPWNKGVLCPVEQKQKIGDANRGNQYSKGIIRSAEFKKKMSKTKKGTPSSFKGKKHSKESRGKISEALRGKLSPMKGRKMSDRAKHKISRALKGRNGLSGEQNPRAKLTEKDVKIIRRFHKNKIISNTEICAKFDISQTTLGHIIARRTWECVE